MFPIMSTETKQETTKYKTIKGYLSFKEAQEALVFHSTNIMNAGTDTAFLKNRIESLKAIMNLLIKYEEKEELKNKI